MLTLLRVPLAFGPDDSSAHAAMELVISIAYWNLQHEIVNAEISREKFNPLRALSQASEILTFEQVLTQFVPQHSKESVHELLSRRKLEVLRIRQQTYLSLEFEINQNILNNELVEKLAIQHIGFTFDQLSSFRSAVVSIQQDQVEQMLYQWEEVKDTDPTYLPKKSPFTISLKHLAQVARLDIAIVDRIADAFNVDIPQHHNARAAYEYWLANLDSIWGRLVRNGGEITILTFGEVGGDSYRKHFENAIKVTDAWDAYEKVRSDSTERMAQEAFSNILDKWSMTPNLNYIGELKGSKDLSRVSTFEAKDTVTFELDILFTRESLALAVEVKSGDTVKAKSAGNPRRLRNGLDSTIISGDSQTFRFSQLLQHFGGYWSGRVWHDLGTIRESFSVVVSLDEIGGIASQSQALADAGLIDQSNRVWVISLHDLLVLREIKVTEVELCAYLRVRTSRLFWKYYSAMEELDFMAAFLRNGLILPPDIAALRKAHSQYSGPTKEQKRVFANFPRQVLGDQMGMINILLQPHIYPHQQASHLDLRSSDVPLRAEIINRLEAIFPDTSLNARTELTALIDDDWRGISNILDGLVRRTKQDGKTHTCALQYFSAANSLTIIIETQGGSNGPLPLTQYVQERKYFSESTLGLGLSFSKSMELTDIVMLDSIHRIDSVLSKQVAQRNFKPMPKNIPPYARKTKVRKRKKR